MRLVASLLTIALVAAPAVAQDDGLTGYWKFNVLEKGKVEPIWLMHIEKDKDGKLTATIEPFKGAPKAKVTEIKTNGDLLSMHLVATIPTPGNPQQVKFEYEARLPKPGAKKILGALIESGELILSVMEATSAKNMFELDREIVLRTPSDPRAMSAIFDVILRAKENNVDAKELQSLVDGSLKAAELYGPRFQRKHHDRMLTVLPAQLAYAEVGAETARKLVKQIDPKLPLDMRSSLLTAAAGLLRAGGQTKEADEIDKGVDKLEADALAEFKNGKDAALNFKTPKFAGRKMKSNRAVLVELFTGAQCAPCVAADMAFDGLEKTYEPADVVLLQYHMHIPGPDMLSNSDSDARFMYYSEAYRKKVVGTPSILFNGKVDAINGGFRDDAPEKYKEYCDVVNKLLETPDTLKLSATAIRSGEKITIAAKVQDFDKPGEKMRLRVVLVEDQVRYKGNNGMQLHHRVVRAFPGGATGVSVKEKNFDHKATIDLNELRASLNKYLNEDSLEGPRPMRLRNLSVVVFVQNDENTEVLQAINVPVTAEK